MEKKKYLEVFGIGIGIQRPCKYLDWDWERGNLYKIFVIGLGIGMPIIQRFRDIRYVIVFVVPCRVFVRQDDLGRILFAYNESIK